LSTFKSTLTFRALSCTHCNWLRTPTHLILILHPIHS